MVAEGRAVLATDRRAGNLREAALDRAIGNKPGGAVNWLGKRRRRGEPDDKQKLFPPGIARS
jgi:hypothetical protein